jgi:hypothetical protein
VIGALLLGHKAQRLSNENIGNGFNAVKSLLTVDGEVALDVSNAHLVLDMLVELRGVPAAAGLVSTIADLALRLIPTGNGGFLTDATLLSPLSQLSEKKVKVSLVPTVEALLPLKHADDAETLYNAFDSLHRISAYKAAPLAVKCTDQILSSVEKRQLVVEVYDMLGNNMRVEGVEVVLIKTVGKDNTVVQGEKFSGNIVDISQYKLDPARYAVSLAVTVAGKSSVVKFQGNFAVVDSIVVNSVHAGVTESKSVSNLPEVMSVNAWNGASGSSVSHDFVHISFSVSAKLEGEKLKKPHQSFVRFTHIQSGFSVLFPATKVGDGTSMDYQTTVSLADVVENFDYLSGAYTSSILIGDATFAEPVEWIVGSLDLKFPAKVVNNLPLYARSLLHTSDTTLTALPEIEHQMRPPAQRASDFMAATFTVLTLIPLLGFIVFNLSLRPNLAYLRSLTSIAFVICLTATLLLYAGYWLAIEGLSFYKTIKYLCFSFPVTLFLGYHSLQSVIKVRERATKKE